ncbi:Transcription factor GTE4 [Senna tora]|uniref:Transcription factor GTE4 n=1 Tax=Senna tora TaxID=362788 RepID=A0A834WW94_9FABA|nr:Transcription factor GTE4 [Senna tora]
MASGPIVGGDDGAKEKQRYTESKVYTRKAYKGPKNKANALTAVVPNTAPTTTAATNEDTNNSSVKNSNVDGTTKNDNNVSVQPPSQTILPEDANSAQPQVDSRLDVVSDDLSALNRQQNEPSSLNCQPDEPSSPDHHQDATPSTRELPTANGAIKPGLDNRIKINLSSRSKQEMQELRRKLENELDTVRSLVRRIEVKQGQIGGFGNSNLLVSDRIDNGTGPRRAQSEVASAGVPRESTRPLHQLSISVLENSQGANENVEKEKRTPKANQFYRNSEFLLGKDKFPPAESNKKSKLNGKKQGGGEMGHGFGVGSKFFKSCSSLLEKLMKHKHGWVFNAPVDVEALGLHDYFTIITHPMDLGTVKTRLNKNFYKSPKEFAEDVRLTFRNAMTYNPPGQDVHIMADQLSKIFEDRWAIIESDYNREMRYALDYGAPLAAPSPLSRKVPALPPPPLDMRKILDRSESMTQPPKFMSITPSSRTPAPKKPKAKDPHKRDMTYEEKQKLSTNLQSLPSEKLDTIVQIIKKRNSALCQHDDEIEVDIDSVDAETLWELDRFVTNYKKSLSKNKRKAELAIQRAEAAKNASQTASVMVEVPKENVADEGNVPPPLPAEGNKQMDNGSRSSSSSSSSSDSGSSSSDSDSESSSASGSDAGSQGT